MNSMKTFLLMLALTGMALLIGELLGGRQGMLIAFFIALAMNVGSYWFSDKIVLATYRAKEIQESDSPQLYAVVRDLAFKANIPMPKVYMIPTDQPNAFATGRNPQHAAVAVTQGILNILDRDELEGVLAHELAHVKHRDILISTIAATIAGAVMLISRFALFFGGSDDDRGNIFVMLLTMILAPIAAMLIQMSISRAREYDADAGGATISGKPWALASALRKLELSVQRAPMNATPETAHMFIVNPFSAKKVAGLFSTHPPTKERIARLEKMR